jgi:hypothetical protein
MNVAPARTRATRWGALTARQRSWAAVISLNAMARPAAFDPGPRMILVRCRTVAKVDSIGFVTGMKMSASPVAVFARLWVGAVVRHTVRPSGTGAPGVKQGGQASLVRWAESPC